MSNQLPQGFPQQSPLAQQVAVLAQRLDEAERKLAGTCCPNAVRDACKCQGGNCSCPAASDSDVDADDADEVKRLRRQLAQAMAAATNPAQMFQPAQPTHTPATVN